MDQESRDWNNNAEAATAEFLDALNPAVALFPSLVRHVDVGAGNVRHRVFLNLGSKLCQELRAIGLLIGHGMNGAAVAVTRIARETNAYAVGIAFGPEAEARALAQYVLNQRPLLELQRLEGTLRRIASDTTNMLNEKVRTELEAEAVRIAARIGSQPLEQGPDWARSFNRLVMEEIRWISSSLDRDVSTLALELIEYANESLAVHARPELVDLYAPDAIGEPDRGDFLAFQLSQLVQIRLLCSSLLSATLHLFALSGQTYPAELARLKEAAARAQALIHERCAS